MSARGLFGSVQILVLLILLSFPSVSVSGPPVVKDPRLQIDLFAEAPDIVTPIGATFDERGRLLVIESHTHQRPKDYEGPGKDRIRALEDTDSDGRADRITTFFEGTEATMSLRTGPDGWIYVATRMKVFRIRDSDGDGVADQQHRLAHLKTDGNYPHNGLSGLAMDGEGGLFFGMGENLGKEYRLVGSDGREQSGSGEGGVFHCDLRGQGLVRIATGFWNPFGMYVDPAGRLFAVGNDADGRPPCRLVQVVETGDYGFQFRYGRSGRHPLQAWDGELPGTLPMLAGTGEAPCEMTRFHDRLCVASWGHHRIEAYRLVPDGASFRAQRRTIVQGDETFRPVAFATAPDGSLYVTDWVSRSYPVHGQGRIWRIRAMKPENSDGGWPSITDEERLAERARSTVDWESLDSSDPFLHQAAVAGLVQSSEFDRVRFDDLATARQRLGYLEALRWRTDHGQADRLEAPIELLRRALDDSDADVRLFAVRWVADAGVDSLRTEIIQQLEDHPDATAALLQASIAAVEWLAEGTNSFDPGNAVRYFVQTLEDRRRPEALRLTALRLLPSDFSGMDAAWLERRLNDPSLVLQRESIRSLVVSRIPDRASLLLRVIRDQTLSAELRADALVGLASDFAQYQTLFERMAEDKHLAVQRAARRIIDGTNRSSTATNLPEINETDTWMNLVGVGGDASAGWRVFFGSPAVRCANCHRYGGRGAKTGPELTGIGARISRRRVLDSLLRPSQEIAPRYVPTLIEMSDGRVIQGIWQGYVVQSRMDRYQLADGSIMEIDPGQVETSRQSPVSIMPEGLHQRLTVDEIRDLLELLHDVPKAVNERR